MKIQGFKSEIGKSKEKCNTKSGSQIGKFKRKSKTQSVGVMWTILYFIRIPSFFSENGIGGGLLRMIDSGLTLSDFNPSDCLENLPPSGFSDL